MKEHDIASICKGMGDKNRLEIITMLSEGELCACKILEQFQITQPTLSHHIKILCEADIITTRKEGKWSYYSINPDTILAVKEFMELLLIKKGRIE